MRPEQKRELSAPRVADRGRTSSQQRDRRAEEHRRQGEEEQVARRVGSQLATRDRLVEQPGQERVEHTRSKLFEAVELLVELVAVPRGQKPEEAWLGGAAQVVSRPVTLHSIVSAAPKGATAGTPQGGAKETPKPAAASTPRIELEVRGIEVDLAPPPAAAPSASAAATGG